MPRCSVYVLRLSVGLVELKVEGLFIQLSIKRDTMEGEEAGHLTLGKLPDGIDNSSLTWVPVRLYTAEDGGMGPPSFAPGEVSLFLGMRLNK